MNTDTEPENVDKPTPALSESASSGKAVRSQPFDKLVEAITRITGKHKTLSSHNRSRLAAQEISHRLKAAASMHTDLTTASQRLKTMTKEDIDKHLLEHKQTVAHDDSATDADVPPVRPVRASGPALIVGCLVFLALMTCLAQEFLRATEYKDHISAGLTALTQRKSEEAQSEFTASLKAYPHDAKAHFYRALAEDKLDDNDRALADYGVAISLEPDNVKLYIARAVLFSKIKRYNQAIGDCETALAVDPQCLDARRVRALSWNCLERYDRATADCDQFLLHYRSIDQTTGEVLANRAYAEFHLGNVEAALRDYTSATSADPGNAKFYACRAVVYKQMRNWKKGIEDCNAAIVLTPTTTVSIDPSIYAVRGACYAALGMKNDALRDFSELVKVFPTAKTRRLRGNARLALKNYKDAMEDFDYVLKEYPHDQDALTKYQKARAGLQAAASSSN